VFGAADDRWRGSTEALRERLGRFVADFDRRLGEHLTACAGVPSELAEAMRYTALLPGKRLRPYLVVRSAELCGAEGEVALPAAVAVECVHAFSLIHDDLPAMDDDDLRRGRPTNHRVFGEAVAILAGDALLARAFEIVAGCDLPAERRVMLVRGLAEAVGWAGMIGGQSADVLGERRRPDLALAEYIHERKTGCLFEVSCRMGALAADAPAGLVESLCRYGRELGLAFQAADDLLDATADATAVGKATGKDEPSGKQSLPRCVGIQQSRVLARQRADQAGAALNDFGADADDLRALVTYVLGRGF
jgi:farnesyl diphosphate synthase